MTQITFELGDHPQETGVFVNPDVRWSLTEIAEEILNLGEEEFVKKHCYYRSKRTGENATNAFDKYQPGKYHGETFKEVMNGTVRARHSDNQPIVNTSTAQRKARYTVIIGDKTITAGANKVQMVHKILSYLIETEGYSPDDLNEQYKGRYFKKFNLLKSFPRGYDSDQMKTDLGKDSTRYGLKYLIEAEGKIWAPCSQWTPDNTSLFIKDMLQFKEVLETEIVINEV
jgi:hypothetical protein